MSDRLHPQAARLAETIGGGLDKLSYPYPATARTCHAALAALVAECDAANTRAGSAERRVRWHEARWKTAAANLLAQIDLRTAANARIAELEQALTLAIRTIKGLSEQQAMDDDWYMGPLDDLRAVLSNGQPQEDGK